MTRRVVPVRMCVGCRERSVASDLLRIVAAPPATPGGPGLLTPDPRRRMPGRGAHVHLDSECLALAERRRAFGRAFKVDGPLDANAVYAWLQAQQAVSPANPERADESR